jgi:hypothetical protein
MKDKIDIIKNQIEEIIKTIPTNNKAIQLVDYMKKLTGEIAT